MIPKVLFTNCVKAIMALNEFEENIYNASNETISLFDMDAIQGVKHELEKLVSYECKDEDNPIAGTILDYFLYDLNCGKDYTDGCFVDTKTNTNIELKTVDDVWNYFIKEHPEIEDKDYIEKEHKIYTDKEFEELLKALF